MCVWFGLIVCVLLSLSLRSVCYDMCLRVFVNVVCNVVCCAVSCSVYTSICIYVCATAFVCDACPLLL